jgi:hypothetical protein
MIRTQVQVPPEQMKWLKKFALKEGVSMSQVIRDSVDFYRLHVEHSGMRKLKKKKALNAVGKFSTKDF